MRGVSIRLHLTAYVSFRDVAKATATSAFEDVLDSLIEYRDDSLAEDRDEIVETIAEAYKLFTNWTLRCSIHERRQDDV